MTTAVCFKCGAFKWGAFNPCGKCGALPVSEDDYVASFLLSDHFSNKEALGQIGRQIACGSKPHIGADTFPPEVLEAILKQARRAKEICERMQANAAQGSPPQGIKLPPTEPGG